jgi:hypothetical protein
MERFLMPHSNSHPKLPAKPHGKARRKSGWKRPVLIVVGVAAALVVAVHIVVPPLLVKFVNKKLDNIPGYRGHLEDIDISLFRGAYTIEKFRLQKLEGDIPVPLFAVEAADFSVEWKALFRGKIVSEITLVKPRLNFVADIDQEQSQTGADNWQKTVEDLFPFTINRFEIRDGAIHYQDMRSKPVVDLRIDNIHALATGLTNAQEAEATEDTEGKQGEGKSEAALPARFNATARAMGHAPLRIDLGLAPLAKDPTFDLDAELTDLDLTTLNAFFEAYAGVDVEKGTFSLFTEATASHGRFQGYAKPLMRDLKILEPEKDDSNPLRLAWEALVAGVSEIFENQPKEQVGTQIPFSGTIEGPNPDIWRTVSALLRNAFIRALRPSLEGTIHLDAGPTLKEEKQQKKKEKKKS